MARQPEIGQGEKVGQHHPDELPAHERRHEGTGQPTTTSGDMLGPGPDCPKGQLR